MARLLFTLASAVSLLICAVMVALGVRSFWRADGIHLASPDLGGKGFQTRYLFSARGTLGYRGYWFDQREIPASPTTVDNSRDGVVTFSYHYSTGRPQTWFVWKDPAVLAAPVSIPGMVAEAGKRNIDASALGFAFRRTDALDSIAPSPYPQVVTHAADRMVGIPHWLLATATAVPPFIWFRRKRVERRLAKGLCRRCGYDLRATPDRCPECGAPVDGASSAPTVS